MWPMPVPYPKLMARHETFGAVRPLPFKMSVNLVVVCLDWLHLRRAATCPQEVVLFQPLNKLQWCVVRTIEGCMDAWKTCGPVDACAMGRTASKIEDLESAISRLSSFVSSSLDVISRLPESGSGVSVKRQVGRFSPGLQKSSPGDVIGTLPGAVGQIATSIQADRLEFKGLPVFDPSPFLDEHTRLIYQFPVLAASEPQDFMQPVPLVKVHGSQQEIWALLKKLDDSDRLGVIKHHQKIHGFEAGLFSVLKDGARDRLIFDSRPFNCLESPPNRFISSMASGANLVDLQIRQEEVCVVSSTDLREYYYSFSATPQRLIRNALKITAWPSQIRSFRCYDPSFEKETKPLTFGLRTMAMGDKCAVEVAQTAHLSILVQLGLVDEHNVICHDMAFPRSLTCVGVVIDDLVIFQRIASHLLSSECADPLHSAQMLDSALDRYRDLGLLPHEGKTRKCETSGEFWGALFDGQKGYVRASLKRVVPVLFITIGVLKLGVCSISLLEVLIGSWTAAFLFRRRMLSLFSTCHTAVQSSSDRSSVIRLSSELKEELFLICSLAPLAATCLKATNSNRLYASDASSWGLAVVSTEIPSWLQGEIHRHRLRRSVWSRLLSPLRSLQRIKGVLPASSELPEGLVLPTHPLHMTLASCLDYQLDLKKRQNPQSHINIKELRGMIESESIQAHGEFPSRFMTLGDSQVSCAVWVKGRGASLSLNQELQQSLPIHLGCGMVSHAGFIPSELNAADDPTRHVALRNAMTPPPFWLSPGSDLTEDERLQLLDEWLEEYDSDPFSISGLPSFDELRRSWDADLPLDQREKSKIFMNASRSRARDRVIKRSQFKQKKSEPLNSRQESKCRASNAENPLSPVLSEEALSVLDRVPKSWFVLPKGWKTSPQWKPSRKGYLDLYSGKKGVANKIRELGQVWAICFELEDDPGQDLSTESNRQLVLDLIRFGAVFACGSAIFCASFSRAVRPAVRDRAHPEGRADITDNMREKIEIGNSHSDFNSAVVWTCKGEDICFWIENPDGSFLWLQPKFIEHGANMHFNSLRVDYCMLSCPWRIRTRIYTNTHLAAQTLFCNRQHTHRKLVGWSRLHRKSWTKVAQVYPRKLSYAISCAVLIDSGLAPDRKRVSIASVARQSHSRIGEASNPGPRRPRSFGRSVGELSGSLLVESSTEALGNKVWEAFRRWSLSYMSGQTFQQFVHVPEILCEMIESFGYHLFEHGASIYLLRQLITFVQRCHPGFRAHLGRAWQLVSKWEALEPIKHRTPLPAVIYRAMVVVSISWGWFKFAAVLIMGFEGICRPGEPLSASRSDLLLPADLIAEDPTAVYLRIRNPKGRRRGIGREQRTKFHGKLFVDYLQHVYGEAPADMRLYPGSSASFRRRWDAVLAALAIPGVLEITPASLRPGGAVKAYREDMEMSRLLWKMRLRNLDTLQHYLQEIGAMTVVHDLPKASLTRIQFCSQFFETILKATSFSVD